MFLAELAGSNLDGALLQRKRFRVLWRCILGAALLACQRQFGVGENSWGMVALSRRGERLL